MQDRTEQTRQFLDFLFEQNEIMQVRTKAPGDQGAAQTYFEKTPKRVHRLTNVIFPIHEDKGRHIWVGVCPRKTKGNNAVKHGRVLWVDLDETIKSVAQAKAALDNSGLPDPSMIVWSGGGVHLYWKLDRAHGPKELRPYSRGVHEALPSDNTHDPTRVMRVPGTYNPKREHDCEIREFHPDRVYAIEEFPQRETPDLPVRVRTDKPKTELSDEDRRTLVANWIDGQKHYMVLGLAAYVRKNLGYSIEQAEELIVDIHREAGYEPDETLYRDIRDTYERPFAKVSTGMLRENGVVLKTRNKPRIRFKSKKKSKPRMRIVDMSQPVQRQEFWMDGMLGPGLLGLWAAPPKTGKSFAALQMGHALASGEPIWDFDTRGPLRVLYFQGELTRQMMMERAHGIFGDRLITDPRKFAVTDKPDEVLSLVEEPEVLYDLAEDFDLIIIDPISFFNTNEENSKSGVRGFMGVFDPLKSEGKSILLVHHTRKLETNRSGQVVPPTMNDVRGSGAFFAAPDSIAVQYPVKSGKATKVKFEFRAAPSRDELTLYRMPNGAFTHDRELFKQTTLGDTFTMNSERTLN